MTNLDSVSERNFDHFVEYSFLVEGTPALCKSPAYRKCSSIFSLLLVGIHISFIFRSVGRYPRDKKSPKVKLWSGHDVATLSTGLSQEINASCRILRYDQLYSSGMDDLFVISNLTILISSSYQLPRNLRLFRRNRNLAVAAQV